MEVFSDWLVLPLALLTLLSGLLLSLGTPWGLTRRGRKQRGQKQRASAHKRVDAEDVRQTA